MARLCGCVHIDAWDVRMCSGCVQDVGYKCMGMDMMVK